MVRKFGEGKVSYKSSGKGKYSAVWIYIPKVIADDEEFPFKNKERVLIEIENGKLVIGKKNELDSIINSYGIENASIPKLLYLKAKENKNKPFLYFKDEVYSYKETNKLSNQIANGLLELTERLDIKRATMGIMMSNCPDYIFSWFGVLKAGFVSVLLNPYVKEKMLEHTLNDSKTKILIVDYVFYKNNKKIIEKEKKLDKIIVRNAPKSFKYTNKLVNFKDIINTNTKKPEVEVNNWNKMEKFYSAGATRMPKGILYRHFISIIGLLIATETEELLFNKNQIIYCPLPLYNGFARLTVILPAIFSGAAIALSEEFNAVTFWDEVKSHNCTGICYFGWLLSLLLKQPPSKSDREHNVSWAFGSVATKEIWESFENRFDIPIYEAYTLAEGAITINKLGSKKGKIGSIGKAISGFKVKIIDDEGNELPPGRDNIGEIVSRISLPIFLDDSSEENWNRSGDIGYKDEDGFIYFVGRDKDIIKRRGRVLNVRNIEKIANLHPFVLESAAFTVPNEENEDQQDIKVCIVLKKPGSITHEDIYEYLTENLAYFLIPRYIEFIDEIYRSPAERVRTFSLKEEWQKEETRKNTWDADIRDFIK